MNCGVRVAASLNGAGEQPHLTTGHIVYAV